MLIEVKDIKSLLGENVINYIDDNIGQTVYISFIK